MSVDWEAVRREFPALERWTCLNTATFGQLPRRAVEAVTRHFADREQNACWNFLDWFDDADRIRAKIARLVNADPVDIGFVSNAATAMGTLLGGLDWKPGDRVLTLAGEFPNNLYTPALVGDLGVEVVEKEWPELYGALDTGVRLVLVSSVNYVTGLRPPLEELAGLCRERGALLYVDGTQSVGALVFDARRIQPAMLAVNAYKWLLGPSGSGFIYVDPELRRRLRPMVVGWRSHKEWRQVDHLHHGTPEFVDAAEKYEGGMLNFPSLYALEASVDLMLEVGLAEIERRVLELAAQVRAVLREAGGQVLADERPHHDSPVIAARFPGRDASALAKTLYARRILASARHGYLRVSVHFYNNEADLERLREGLRGAL